MSDLQIIVREPPLSVYCPHCEAYLLVLFTLGEVECEMCGKTFEIVEADKEE